MRPVLKRRGSRAVRVRLSASPLAGESGRMASEMRRRRIILLLALAAVAAGFLLCWPRGPKEPVYQGRLLSQWLKETLEVPGTQKRTQAEKAVKAIGTNALPFLLYEFSRPLPLRIESFNLWLSAHRMSFLQLSSGRNRRDRINSAAGGLQILGPDAIPALPIMASYLDDSYKSAVATAVMSGCGEPGLPYLLKAIASTNEQTFLAGAQALGWLAAETEAAIPHVIGFLDHTNYDVRFKAASALRWAKQRPDLTIPALIKRLSDPSGRVRGAVAVSLSGLGPAARPAVPELLRLMRISDPKLASEASNAVFKIDPAALPSPRP